MHGAVCGEHFVARLPVVTATEISYFSSGLHQDHSTGRHIPRADPGFDTGFEPSCRDIAYLCCCRSHQAGSSSKTIQAVDQVESYRTVSIRVIRKSQVDKGFVEIGHIRYMDLLPAQIRLTAFPGV